MTLNVQAGAVLKADNSEKKFVAAYIGKPAAPHEAFILANKAQNVKLIGSGTIDGDGEHSWWPEALEVRKAVRSGNSALFEKRFPGVKLANGMPRPWLVEFNEVEGGVIYGLNFVNSPMWNLVIRNCNDVLLDSVKVTAPVESPNTDGVDIVSSKYVTVINSEIYTGDDNVAIKSGVDQGTAGPSENIVIKDSLFREGHGVSIGSETANGIGEVTVENCKFINTENGIRIKSARDRGNKIGPLNVDGITMDSVDTPILVTFSYAGQSGAAGLGLVEELEAQEVTATTPQVNGVTIRNLEAKDAKIAALLSGLPESIVNNVLFENVAIDSELGIQARYVNGTLINTQVTAQKGDPLVRGPQAKIKEAR